MANVIDLDISNFISVIHFEILTPQVAFGEDLRFTFTLQNLSDQPLRLDIRYEILHPDPDGGMVRRLYKLTSRKGPSGYLLYNRSHTIRKDTFPANGLFPTKPIPCELKMVINGQILQSAGFEVI